MLVAAIATLAISAWGTGRVLAEWEARSARLAARVGDLDLGDRSRIVLRAVPTGDPWRFSWRYFFPAGTRRQRADLGPHGPGRPATVPSTSPLDEEGLLKRSSRVDDGEGGAVVRCVPEGRSWQQVFGDASLAAFLRDHRDRIEVERAGIARPAAMGPGEPLVVLRLGVPPSLVAEAAGRLTPAAAACLPDLFRYTINPAEGGR